MLITAEMMAKMMTMMRGSGIEASALQQWGPKALRTQERLTLAGPRFLMIGTIVLAT